MKKTSFDRFYSFAYLRLCVERLRASPRATYRDSRADG